MEKSKKFLFILRCFFRNRGSGKTLGFCDSFKITVALESVGARSRALV